MIIELTIFCIAAFLIIWTYFGYYAILKVLSLQFSRKQIREDYFPEITFIITANNEEKNIDRKIENTFDQEYPKEKLNIIIVSDGSTDRTEEIIKSYEPKGVRLIAIPERHGKHYGQVLGIEEAATDIVVLSDATTFIDKDAVKNIVRNFADPKVGCVSSTDKPELKKGNTSAEGAYVKYEMKLRCLESKVGSLVGASGSFYALRKNLHDKFYADMSLDFYIPILTRMRGYRTVMDLDAIGYYKTLKKPGGEFTRKVRTIVHGIDVLFFFKEILNPFKYGFFAFQIFSHKLCRWLVPFNLILLFSTNLLLLDNGAFYKLLFILQIMLYTVALLAHLIPNLQKPILFRIPHFFVMTNLSILISWYKYLSGRRYVIWEPTKR